MSTEDTPDYVEAYYRGQVYLVIRDDGQLFPECLKCPYWEGDCTKILTKTEMYKATLSYEVCPYVSGRELLYGEVFK